MYFLPIIKTKHTLAWAVRSGPFHSEWKTKAKPFHPTLWVREFGLCYWPFTMSSYTASTRNKNVSLLWEHHFIGNAIHPCEHCVFAAWNARVQMGYRFQIRDGIERLKKPPEFFNARLCSRRRDLVIQDDHSCVKCAALLIDIAQVADLSCGEFHTLCS